MESIALLTDLYELTMAHGYWKAGLSSTEGVFHLFFRKQPFGGNFAIAAGLETALEFLEKLQFSSSDLAYLATLKGEGKKPLFETEFLDQLSRFTLTCDIDAMPEGTPVFPYEPLMRVQGPLIQVQILESLLLNVINFQTLIATKASRICQAAFPGPVIEFGLRRAQGVDGAISAARAAFIGGCTSTSNVLAGKQFNIPVRGTHAHSWIMAFPTEKEAFTAWGKCMPHNLTFLLDTYDSIRATHHVVEIAKQLKLPSFAVRLDSGDLASLSRQVRSILDDAGFSKASIMASNELDEMTITDLKKRGARIDSWGVGTHLVTGQNQPALDGVYKLSAIRNSPKTPWIYKAKKSQQLAKSTDPGILQVRRFSDASGYVGDIIYDTIAPLPKKWEGVGRFTPTQTHQFSSNLTSHDLLIPIMRKGKRILPPLNLQEIQKKTAAELKRLPSSIRELFNPEPYFVGLEKSLEHLKRALLEKL